MAHQVLIDGYNVIKNNPMFQAIETKSFAEARTVLIKQLKNRYRHSAYLIVLVFDGDGKHEQTSHDEHIRIIFSRYGETADSVIARLAYEARQNGHTITLYSDDGEVKQNVQKQGGKIQTTHQLTTRLNAVPHDIAILSQHRQAMRRIYGMDPAYKPDDEIESHHQIKDRKKKKSAKHRR